MVRPLPVPTWPIRTAQRVAAEGLTRLQRHPLAMDTHFVHSLVLTWAVPPAAVTSVLAPGLSLDTDTDSAGVEWAFVAAALVELEGLRPHLVPDLVPAGLRERLPRGPGVGGRQVMVGYRVFCTMPTARGRTMRGLRILRSQASSPSAVLGANLTTRYHYERAEARVWRPAGEELDRGEVSAGEDRLRFTVSSADGSADLDVTARLDRSELPEGSVFADARTARRFAGPLPYTFSPDPEGIVVVKASREDWQPKPVAVEARRATFLEHGMLAGVDTRLSNAFHVADLDYGWQRGELHRTEPQPPEPPGR